ncbi:hypothetical protein [Devosia sp. SD17-2]|uniref:hypothetical protein n=1 Tax=Devosia sp. SD17-2 TaxID=2976459 RepID=UPI0023D869CE|nr:hypothetical protein [Devosia sp. SD17-2]WEJ32838.1 hypothetical protein NYQ88_18480 [Devosia sp. SD17-2]
MLNISANPEHALFLPAPNFNFANAVMNPAPRPLPGGLTMADLNFLQSTSSLFTYEAVLYSAAFGVGQLNPTMITTRDRLSTTVVGDSGGFSVIGGSIKTPHKIFRVQVLQWQERNCDVGIVLDVPTRSLNVQGSGYTQFDQCLNQTEQNTQYAISNRSRADMIICNVMQGRDHAEADAWFKRMSPYQRHLEGIALAGDTKQDMWFWNDRLIQMRDAGLLDRLQWIHVLGTAQPGFGVMLTGLQKAMRKHLKRPIRISYDSARAFRNVQANHIITRGLRETGRDFSLWPYQFSKSASALDRSKPFPFPSPLGDLCTYGDFNPGNPNRLGGWDATGLMMLSNHEVYKEVQAIAEANRLADAEVTVGGGTPWHVRRSWEAFDLIWGTSRPDVHLKKYRQFLTHYASTLNGTDDER